jgi:hypothetical protein
LSLVFSTTPNPVILKPGSIPRMMIDSLNL